MHVDESRPGIGIRLDILRSIFDDIDSSEKLQSIFGKPVSSRLGLVVDDRDIKIVEGGLVKLSETQKKAFLEELDRILRKRILEAKDI